MIKRLSCCAIAFFLILTALPARAHKVNIFAFVQGDTIHTESGYSKSRRVRHGTVEVRNAADNALLLSGTTDVNGSFSFPIPREAKAAGMDILLVLLAGQGHRSEWVVKSTEYGSGERNAGVPSVTPSVSSSDDMSSSAGNLEGMDALVEKAVRKAVSEELGVLRKMLAEMHSGEPGMREIIGGLGYFVGIIGIVAYVRSRRPE